MQLLIIIVCIVVGLRIVVALATRFSALAVLIQALFLWLVRPLEILRQASEQAAHVCYLGFQSRIHLPPQPLQPVGEPDSPILNIVSRLCMFVVSLCIIIGDLELARYRQVTLFHLLLSTQADIPLQDYAAAAMWVCASMIFGFFLTEACGVMPKGVHALTLNSKLRRWCVGILSFVLLVASILTMAAFYGYGQRIIVQLPDDPDLAINITTAFGFIMGWASVGALWLIKIGFSAVICIACGVLYCCCSFIQLICALLSGSIEAFTAIIPANTTQPLPATTEATPLPLLDNPQATQEELLMANEKRNITLMGYGSYASRIIPAFLHSSIVHGITPYITQVGLVDTSGFYTQTIALSLPNGILSITPSRSEIHTAYADESRQSATTCLATIMHNSAVENTKVKHAGTVIIASDFSLLPKIAPAITAHKHRLPNHTFILLTQQPTQEECERDPSANETLQQLQEGPDRVITACILTSPTSEGTLRNGVKTTDEAIAQPIMNMCIAHLHASMNLTIGEAFAAILGTASYCGVSLAVAPVAIQTIANAWKFFRFFARGAGDKGTGDYDDLVAQVKTVTAEVTGNSATCATIAPVDLTKPRIIVYSLPLHTTDKHFTDLCDFIHYYVNTNYPGTTIIATQANGTSLPYMKPGYKVQATCFYPIDTPLPHAPASTTISETKVLEASTPKRTNGHRRITETV